MWLIRLLVTILSSAWPLTLAGSDSGKGPYFLVTPEDATVLVETRHVFKCEADGYPPPKVRWLYKREPLRHDEYHRVTRSGNLKLQRVLVRDTGHYQCIAENEFGTAVSSPVYLNVQAAVEIIRPIPANRIVDYGTRVQLTCEAVGLPHPTIAWYRNDQPFVDPETQMIYSNSVIFVNATETSSYRCVAANRVSSLGEQTAMSRGNITVRPHEVNTDRGVCAPYNGTICSGYLGRRMVFYNTSLDHPADLHERLVVGLWTEMIENLESFCRIPAEKMLCHYAFPDCDTSSGEPMPKPLCREECLAVRDPICQREWLSIKKNTDDGIYFKNRGHFRLPDCETLPSHGGYGASMDNATCSYADIFEKIESERLTTDCYHDNGWHYRGNVTETETGLPCQAWDQQTPHSHKRLPEVFPSLLGAKNACRNPAGEEDRPWCFVDDPVMRWEFCNIPKCGGPGVRSNVHPVKEPFINVETIVIIAAVAAVALTLIGLITVLCCRLCRHKKRIEYNSAPQYDIDIDIEKLPTNASYHQCPQVHELNPKLKKKKVPTATLR